MTYPERSAEAAQMAVELINAVDPRTCWTLRSANTFATINTFAGYIDETLAFRKRVDEVARRALPYLNGLSVQGELRSIMLPDPVDPDVLLARKVAVARLREFGYEEVAAGVEDGTITNSPTYLSVLAGIKAAREADNAHT